MTNNKGRRRYDFSRIPSPIELPNLIEVQKESYRRFLQMEVPPDKREDIGLQAVFKSIFPVYDFRGTYSLEFVSCSIGNWECACGKLKGLEELIITCRKCGERLVPSFSEREEMLVCPYCGTTNRQQPRRCPFCGKKVRLQIKYNVQECQERGMTYAVPLKVTIRLVGWEKDPQTGTRSVRDIKEQEVYFGEIPLMTEKGTFIINGTERVIVSQLHRSPGVFFHLDDSETLHYGQVIPYRGSWVEYEYDAKDHLYVRVDRKRKFLSSIFLRALGLGTDEETFRVFYRPIKLHTRDGEIYYPLCEEGIGLKVKKKIVDPNGQKTVVAAGKRLSQSAYKELKKLGIKEFCIPPEELRGCYSLADVVDKETGEVLIEVNEEVISRIGELIEHHVESFEVFCPDKENIGATISNTFRKHKRDYSHIKTQTDALIEIYKRLRPGDPPTTESARNLFNAMFNNPHRYDFSPVGRLKLNNKLGLNTALEERLLRLEDHINVIKYLLWLKRGIPKVKVKYSDHQGNRDEKWITVSVDDIDHLGNRRVRSVGELLENQFRIGLIRMERAVKEKMSSYQEIATAMPHDLINAKPVLAAVKEFFGSSQLSQFMDQTNPLSEITHKRRLSALGPGGLSRERAGFEVRDVHPTHYGRICPIETPEGPNIGLISSLSCYGRINEFGFIESPYRKVKDGKVLNHYKIIDPGDTEFSLGAIVEESELVEANNRLREEKKRGATAKPYVFYLSAWEEDKEKEDGKNKYIIAQANTPLDEHNRITAKRVNARQGGDFIMASPEEVDFIDVSPKQLVSVAASLIPFLEHDDANRALMGSNMQRQAVPLLTPETPLVGTGIEEVTARDSGAVVICRKSGVVDSVDSQRIIIRVTSEGGSPEEEEEAKADVYHLVKFRRSNQNTCVNQRPIVKEGDYVTKGEVIADGPSTDHGELALGRNILVAFMPWRGYNFEDAILVSKRLVKEDLYTSIHIEEFEIEARDTKLGPEEITRDIPNVSEEFLEQLDDCGIIKIGSYVKPGDILVGKVTRKGETQLTPEEKLLRAIFGEKAGEWRDASLVCPPGIEGIVVDVKIFSRKGVEKDQRSREIEQMIVSRMEKTLNDEIRIVNTERDQSITKIVANVTLTAPLVDPSTGKVLLTKGSKLTPERLAELPKEVIRLIKVKKEFQSKLNGLNQRAERQIEALRESFEERVEQLQRGDELAPGVIKLVKVYVAMKRKMSVGDKMAGRHGNKGVISRILPEEDMPFLPDGTPVDIVLNPLGVPSRMNVGQILETHLGWAAKVLGICFATPVFDGATEEDIKKLLIKANLPLTGKLRLYDGLTGEPFEQLVTVGYIYIMKLSHMVDDKIHARSIGPYSLITQQPLGGKAQFGGQRFGEMEVWALEAYGAAHTLQELLTVKSDDVYGRSKIYEAIVKGESAMEPGIPESFNVLVRELQSLCLNVELLKEKR